MNIKKYSYIYIITFFILLSIILFIFYLPSLKNQDINENKEEIIYKYNTIIKECINLCKYAKEKNINLSYGPCLSDLYPKNWGYKGWVCDIAHWPRKSIDNQYTCSNFGKTAFNFIELNPECVPIRIYVYKETKYPIILKEK